MPPQPQGTRPNGPGSAEGSPTPDDDRNRRVEEFLPLAERLARRYADRGEPREDLVQVACLGLVKAADHFDPDVGFEFSAFAASYIIGELKHHFRDKGWSVRVPRRIQELYLEVNATIAELSQDLGRSPTVREIARACSASEAEVISAIAAGQGYRASSLDAPGAHGQTLLEQVEAERTAPDESDSLGELFPRFDRLSLRDRAIVRLRFVEELSQNEIAERMGLSQMHISRLLRSALETLRGPPGEKADG